MRNLGGQTAILRGSVHGGGQWKLSCGFPTWLVRRGELARVLIEVSVIAKWCLRCLVGQSGEKLHSLKAHGIFTITRVAPVTSVMWQFLLGRVSSSAGSSSRVGSVTR